MERSALARCLPQISQALWSDNDRSQSLAIESFATVSLLDLPFERTVERTTKILIDRANQMGTGVNREALSNPFYRLSAELRVILVALHVARWSYERLARLLDQTPEEVARAAWKARVHLASQSPIRKPNRSYPSGHKLGPNCPEYDPDAPWAQKFLDEQLGQNEQLFFQNHLMACDGCRIALNRCRDLYYQIEELLPVSALIVGEEDNWVRLYEKTQSVLHPGLGRRLWTSIYSLFYRNDVQAVGLFCIILYTLKHLFK